MDQYYFDYGNCSELALATFESLEEELFEVMDELAIENRGEINEAMELSVLELLINPYGILDDLSEACAIYFDGELTALSFDREVTQLIAPYLVKIADHRGVHAYFVHHPTKEVIKEELQKLLDIEKSGEEEQGYPAFKPNVDKIEIESVYGALIELYHSVKDNESVNHEAVTAAHGALNAVGLVDADGESTNAPIPKIRVSKKLIKEEIHLDSQYEIVQKIVPMSLLEEAREVAQDYAYLTCEEAG